MFAKIRPHIIVSPDPSINKKSIFAVSFLANPFPDTEYFSCVISEIKEAFAEIGIAY